MQTMTDHTIRTRGVPPFAIDETHVDHNGDEWYIITVFVTSLDNWLQEICVINDTMDRADQKERCGRASSHPTHYQYPRYNVHSSLMSYIVIKWS